MAARSTESRQKPKGDKRHRTRAALLEAARALIREKGYGRTTLEEVAARAGMTTGAIYGNFRNRDELFMALGDAYWPPIKPRVAPGATFAELMRAMAAALIAALPDRSVAAVGRLTGIAYALEHPELRQRVREITAASYEVGAAWLATLADGAGPCDPCAHRGPGAAAPAHTGAVS
jgi:AcrR family transcriptional regulator